MEWPTDKSRRLQQTNPISEWNSGFLANHKLIHTQIISFISIARATFNGTLNTSTVCSPTGMLQYQHINRPRRASGYSSNQDSRRSAKEKGDWSFATHCMTLAIRRIVALCRHSTSNDKLDMPYLYVMDSQRKYQPALTLSCTSERRRRGLKKVPKLDVALRIPPLNATNQTLCDMLDDIKC